MQAAAWAATRWRRSHGPAPRAVRTGPGGSVAARFSSLAAGALRCRPSGPARSIAQPATPSPRRSCALPNRPRSRRFDPPRATPRCPGGASGLRWPWPGRHLSCCGRPRLTGASSGLPGWRAGEKRRCGSSSAARSPRGWRLPACRPATRAPGAARRCCWSGSVVAFGPVRGRGRRGDRRSPPPRSAAACCVRSIRRSADLLTALSGGRHRHFRRDRRHRGDALALAGRLRGGARRRLRGPPARGHRRTDPRAARLVGTACGTVRVDGLLPWALLAAVVAVQIAVAARPEVGTDALGDAPRDRDRNGARAPLPLRRHAPRLGGDAARRRLAVRRGLPVRRRGRGATRQPRRLLLVARVDRSARRRQDRDGGPRAVVAAALFASMPLAFTETGSLFIENCWTALLLGGTCDRRTRSPRAQHRMGARLPLARRRRHAGQGHRALLGRAAAAGRRAGRCGAACARSARAVGGARARAGGAGLALRRTPGGEPGTRCSRS